MPNWYSDYDDRDTPDDNDVAIIAERQRRELKPHITALPSHYNPGKFYMPYDMDGSFFLDIDEMNESEFEAYYNKQQAYKQQKPSQNITPIIKQSKPTTPQELPPPVCNSCNTPMTPRMGRFGKFYFCNNGCESQPTISDKAWRLCNETI